jgi:glycosyltransferase involved in cell wall biosynthesis
VETKNKMKVLIFDPYLDTFGGGERYVLGVAQSLMKNGHSVVFSWPNNNFVQKTKSRFGISLNDITIDPESHVLFRKPGGLIKKYFLTRKYDLIFWVSDGSLPFLFSKNNLVHFQVPFLKDPESNPLIKLLKVSLINKFVYNSEFTRKILENHLPKSKGFTLYPPIDVDSFSKRSPVKTKTILSVGRFDSPSHPKRQDLLIEAFKLFSKKHPGYKLILTGGLMADASLLDSLRNSATGFKVEFIVNPDFETLINLYQTSKFFWHAAGMEVDETLHPDKVEHFGISVVEAMAAGSIPIVANKGGLKEIVSPESGIVCKDTQDMANFTSQIIMNKTSFLSLSNGAILRAKDFSLIVFANKLKSII